MMKRRKDLKRKSPAFWGLDLLKINRIVIGHAGKIDQGYREKEVLCFW